MRAALRDVVLARRAIPYLVRDEFTTALSAGSVNATSADPGPGTRTVTDTNSKLSLSSGAATYATGGAGTGDPGLWYAALTRTAGRFFKANFRVTTTNTIGVAWDNNQAAGTIDGFRITTTFGALDNGATGAVVAALSTSTDYDLYVILRAAGAALMVSGGAFTFPTLLWLSGSNNSASMSPALVSIGTTPVWTSSYLRVPDTLWLPIPLASDGFASAFGTTDGLGHAETSGIGAGGSGVPWTQQVATWTVTTAKALAATTSGGIAIATVPAGTADVIAEVKVVRSAGQGGLVLRYADSSNYLYANHDGTNAFLKQVLAGVTTTLITAAATYSASAVLRCDLSGQAGRLYYNGALVNSTASIDASLTASKHGLYATDTTVTHDDFCCWAKGTAGEYAVLNGY